MMTDLDVFLADVQHADVPLEVKDKLIAWRRGVISTQDLRDFVADGFASVDPHYRSDVSRWYVDFMISKYD